MEAVLLDFYGGNKTLVKKIIPPLELAREKF